MYLTQFLFLIELGIRFFIHEEKRLLSVMQKKWNRSKEV